MSNGKLKSAYELAMERLSRKDPELAHSELSEETREKIQAVRREYEAKIAERKIMLSSRLKEIAAAMSPVEALQHRGDLESEHERSVAVLKAAMEEKIREIRGVEEKK
ncbi:MAG TPA: hypothetical protein PLV45_02370 [bacterium]|nr:hypothetical protein [bacterium]